MCPQFTGTCPDCGTTIFTDSTRCLPCSQRARRARERGELRQPFLNPDDPSGLTMIVPLTRGKVAVIDTDDAPLIRGHIWCARFSQGQWYAQTTLYNADGTTSMVQMHQVICDPVSGQEIDHWDRDGLNNRRKNLRPCTSSQNKCNRLTRSATGFRGVYFRKDIKSGRKWAASITANRCHITLGGFDTPEEAARAYDARARIEFGEFARCNFQDDDS